MNLSVTQLHPATNQDQINTRFLEAAAMDDADVLRLCLRQGANINVRSDHNETALARACREGRGEMVDLLLGFGASLDSQDRDGHTALGLATRGHHLLIAEKLIRMGADITIENKYGEKPLDIALKSGCPTLVALFEQPLKDLLARIPSADAGPMLRYRTAPSTPPDPHGDTMLTWAAREGQENVVRAMIQAGADIHIRNRAGHTPLQVATEAGHREVIELLVAAEENLMMRYASDVDETGAHLPI